MPIDNCLLILSDNENYAVQRFRVDVDKPTNDSTGVPSGKPRLTLCSIQVSVPMDTDLKTFYEWESKQNDKKTVTIDFLDDGQSTKNYKLTDAYLISLDTEINCSSHGGVNRIVRVDLSVMKLDVEGTHFDFT